MEIRFNPITHFPEVRVPGSKSIANRMLVIKSLYWPQLILKNIPESDDTALLLHAIDTLNDASSPNNLNAGEGGTTFRFLTALVAAKNCTGEVHASPQLLKRPNSPLIDALHSAGFNVTYDATIGSRIQPSKRSTIKGNWTVDTSTSSQFASALALIAPSMPIPIEIQLSKNSVSTAYLDMTLKLMQQYDIDIRRVGSTLYSKPFEPKTKAITHTVESDWSGLSYFVSAALLTKTRIHIYNVSQGSVQPDQACLAFFTNFGGKYLFEGQMLVLDGSQCKAPELITRDYKDCPDLYPAEKVTCFAIGTTLIASGTEHIKHKESNRVDVLDRELKKWSDDVPDFESHDDHRIAMSLSVLAAIKPIIIRKPDVVSKSFPDFWTQLSKLGYSYHGK